MSDDAELDDELVVDRDALRRKRVKALETALHHVQRNHLEREDRMVAAEELLAYETFTAAQIAGWLGLSPWALEGRGGARAWGISSLTEKQLPMALELAKAGVERERPKTLIYEAYQRGGMSFNVIGGLLDVHKNIVRRIVRRVEGEPWT
ncbi:hypothetical protein [Pseudolysinimonas sp.]|uniref:hypothetical protein n=1 Tax=Pseudolysinimonas sp. TaxID=2680009 RepID=UPI003F7F5808